MWNQPWPMRSRAPASVSGEDSEEDGSGTVDCKEFTRALLLLGVPCTRDEAEELFDDLDMDGSGELEYRELYRQLRERMDGEVGSGLEDPEQRKKRLAKAARRRARRKRRAERESAGHARAVVLSELARR